MLSKSNHKLVICAVYTLETKKKTSCVLQITMLINSEVIVFLNFRIRVWKLIEIVR